MESGADYKSYVAAMQNYKIGDGRKSVQEPFADDFEEIYAKATTADVKLESAKSFIDNLSSDEMYTLQKYNGLAEAIDKRSLSEEGAYNLLMHDNEQYDFDSDGNMSVGAANVMMPVPKTMPADVRDAYITALNSLEGKDRLMSMSLTFDMSRIKSIMDGTPYEPETIDYNYLKDRVDSMLNPKGGAFTSEEAKASISAFWDAFEQAYGSDNSSVKEEDERDPAVEKFLEDLRTKGAVGFLADFNKEKIEKKIEEFREKLLKQMGNSPEAMEDIEKLVESYKKQLLEELQASLDSSKGDKNSTVNSQSITKILLDMQSSETKPLEKLLKKTS